MKVRLAYGRGHLSVDLPDDRTTVIEPAHRPGLPEEKAAVMAALDDPVAAAPLSERIGPGARVCIAFTDVTRATPNERIIPWLLEYLRHVPARNVTLLNQLGSHRPSTRSELETMLTPEVVAKYRVLDHRSDDASALVAFGATRDGTPALINRHLAEADLRIVTGFIEPHFFAGFSGGPKGIMPGCAGLATILSNHCAANIGDPAATFGVTEGNPVWEEMRDIAVRVGPSFLLNVTLNERRQITGVFAGDLVAAHRAGCEFVRESAMQEVDALFDVVVTTNSGHPLDLNLYQGVKGMSAGARIVREGGLLVLACECTEGVPAGSPMDRLLRSASGPEHILAMLARPGFVVPEQWQAQILALVRRRAQVLVHSALPDEVVRAAHLLPCHDIGAAVTARLRQLGPAARIAVLPQGPLTIPYLRIAAPAQ